MAMDPSKRDCIHLVPFLSRQTAETTILETALKSGLVKRVCVIRPNNVFYTKFENGSRQLFCCLANSEHMTKNNGSLIFTFKRTVTDLINLSHDRHIRIGVLCSDAVLHILCTDSKGTSHWDKLCSVNLEIDPLRADMIAYSRTYNMLFWPKISGDRWQLIAFDIQKKVRGVLFNNVQECSLQVNMTSLIFLYAKHGIMFVRFDEFFPNDPPNHYHSASHRSPRYLDGVHKRTAHGDYWSPASMTLERVRVEDFKPRVCSQKLNGHCLSHDRSVLYVLYGRTVYSLSVTSCMPLTRIDIPDDMDSFHFMFLGRITVLQGDTKTVAYLNSSKPVKTMQRNLKSAGFGYVWDNSGVYQIRMCNPQDTGEEYPRGEMMPANSFCAANGISRALIPHEVMISSQGLMARHFPRRVPYA